MSYIKQTFRYDYVPEEELPALIEFLKNMADTALPPGLPVFSMAAHRPNRYELVVTDGSSLCSRVVVKPRAKGVTFLLESQAPEEPPEAFTQAVFAKAAQEVLRFNNWDKKFPPPVTNTYTYDDLGAQNTFEALVAFDEQLAERLEGMKWNLFSPNQLNRPLSEFNQQCAVQSTATHICAGFARIEVFGSKACTSVTIYFYPGSLQVMAEGELIEDKRTFPWVLEITRDLVITLLDDYYDSGVNIETGLTLN